MSASTQRRDLLATLMPITRALRRIEEAAAARESLTMWQYAILSVVAQSPGLNQREVAAYLQYSQNRIVADLQALERLGLLTRQPGADRRANRLASTTAGATTQQRIQAAIHDREDQLLGGLSQPERDCFALAARHLARQVREPLPSADP